MPSGEDMVKRLEAMKGLGFTLSEAVQKVLDVSIAEFAREAGCRAPEVSMCLLAYPGRVYSDIRDALAGRLGITRADIDRLIDGEPAETEEPSEATAAAS